MTHIFFFIIFAKILIHKIMDAEALKIILDLQKKVVAYQRAMDDLILISMGENIAQINYCVGEPLQSSVKILSDALRTKQ